ncbi:MAG: polysaccharide deacetylase family protein [Fimbriimonadaceae bacterium]
MRQGPVFYDPKGKRGRAVAHGGGVAGIVVAVVSTIFVISLFGASLVPHKGVRSKQRLVPTNSRPGVPSGLVTGKIRAQLIKLIAAGKHRPVATPGSAQRIIGFYNGDDAGYLSFTKNESVLSHFMPQWLRLREDGTDVVTDELDYDPNLADIKARCRANHIKLEPILTNYEVDGFSTSTAHALLSSPASMDRVIRRITSKLLEQNMDGLNVDVESIDVADRNAFVQFLAGLRASFAPVHLELSVDLEGQINPDWQAKYASVCDFGVLMAYDEHDESGMPGPISSWGFVERTLRAALARIPANKLVLGIGAYSLDWGENAAGADGSETYQEALTAASDYFGSDSARTAIKFDPASLNVYYEYTDDNNKPRVCWMQDAISAYNSWTIGRDLGINGFSVWAMGQEDPSIWKFLNRQTSDFPDPASQLGTIRFPYEVDNVGKGDLLNVKSRPSAGQRAIGLDDRTGLITSLEYRQFASPWVIDHHGYIPKRVVLTFDDGPDPNYTPRVLDILKRENVKATFFMVGEKMEENPRLVQRVYAEGHEIGSHTFFHPDLSLVSDRRIMLELNSTQRSIESIVGRSTIMLRPPYNADRDPANESEVHPISVADNLGYMIVGETADPSDWDPVRQDPVTGRFRPRTAQDIIADTIAQVKLYDQPKKSNRDAGNCILLHDAGGPRENTIAALPGIIHELRARGYKFCNVSDLLSEKDAKGEWVPSTRDYLMPPVPDRDRTLILLDKIAFTTIFTFLQLLAIAFVTAVALGVGRVLLITPLALIYERRQRRRVYAASFQPPISVVIAAFNEEQVVVRTIQSILTSIYPVPEVVVVDDGSSDGTSAAVTAAFGGDPRVRLFRQENAGKAEALNHALSESHNDILISVDADTQLLPETIGLLVRHFADPAVGAVAGNVQVGNLHNVVTTWQGIEYTTSQNMDRRAYGLLRCITVVPGAIGSWRKAAVVAVGGHQSDTLAEDMDLTWRLRIAGWVQETESEAFAYTEAPETIPTFFRQRFRWTYGTLQCLVKHRRALFKHGFFGWFALPVTWVFQIGFQVIAPLVDLQMLISLFGFVLALFAAGSSEESSPLGQAITNMKEAGVLYMVLFAVELLSALVAYRLERKRIASLWWLFLQRFVYRQIMYAVIYKSLMTALRGARQGWGKLDRTASVKM